MEVNRVELQRKTKAELFDMIEERQEKINEALAEISRAMNCCESIETECVLAEIKELLR